MSVISRPLSINFVLGPTAEVPTGSTRCLFEYVRRLKAVGHHVSLTTWPKFLWHTDQPFPGLDVQVPIFYDTRAEPNHLPLHLLEKNPRDYLGELQYFSAFLNLVTPVIPQADVIIAGSWEGIMPAWQCGQGKPVHFPQHYDEILFSLEDASLHGLRSNSLIKLLCRSALQLPIYRVANSSWLAGEFRRRFGQNIPFVQNGVDAAQFHPRDKLSSRDGIIRVVTYSRPERWKGFQDAAPAMQDLMRRHPGKIEWHVYGLPHPVLGPTNPAAPYKFHGTLDPSRLSQLYAECDIALCPSWYEGFAVPPLEAMACGTAVITTRYGTEDYAIDDHNAIVARPRVVSDLAIALDGLVRAPELRKTLERNGRAMAESLTWDKAVSAREELLYRIVGNEFPSTGLQGIQNGITDGNGIPFENLSGDLDCREGDLLAGTKGDYYLVECGNLRQVNNPSAIGLDPENARPIDVLSLLRNVQGTQITSSANYYALRY